MTGQAVDATRTGGCLCGAVRYALSGPLRDVIACHCRECRRQTGHYLAATAVKRRYFALLRDDGLRWYQSSAIARRGFCAACGSTLFWDAPAYPHLAIAAGSLDDDAGLRLVVHIFVEECGHYYTPGDGAPTVRGRDHGLAVPE
ncbi:MAG: GFA family protein [Gammaproteobacteria bacterium]|nr:GFA family protein [Gammaproteobacteria bacterium]